MKASDGEDDGVSRRVKAAPIPPEDLVLEGRRIGGLPVEVPAGLQFRCERRHDGEGIGQVLDHVVHDDHPAGRQEGQQILERRPDDRDSIRAMNDLLLVTDLVADELDFRQGLGGPANERTVSATVVEHCPAAATEKPLKSADSHLVAEEHQEAAIAHAVIALSIEGCELVRSRHRPLEERSAARATIICRDVIETVLVVGDLHRSEHVLALARWADGPTLLRPSPFFSRWVAHVTPT